MAREKCPCGRTGAVLRPAGRKDDRLFINEAPLYPAQIREVISRLVAPGQPFHITIEDRHIAVDLEVSTRYFSDTMRPMAELRRRLQTEMLDRFGIDTVIRYVEKCE